MTVASHTGSPTALRNIHSLVDMLAHSVAHHSAETLFLTKSDGAWHPTSYAAFEQQVNHLRGGMAALGVGPGDRVGIIANNCIEWAAAGYATYGLGAAFVPMYESQVDKEWAFIARDAGIKLLFVASPDVFQRVSRFSLAIPCLEHLVLLGGKGDAKVTYRSLSAAGERMPHRALHQAPSATACLMYTSGTTGDPKGVVLSHANILSNVAALLQVIPLSTEYRTLSFLPWAHAFGHTVELHLLIAVGASMAIAESVEALVANFSEVRPTVLVAVPRVFERVHAGVHALIARKAAPIRWLFQHGMALAHDKMHGRTLGRGARLLLALADLLVFRTIRARFGGRLRFAVSGAAALSPEAGELMEAIGVAVYQGYGLTEASPVVSANFPGQSKRGSVGRPLPDVTVEIDHRHRAGDDVREGEIVVRGANVMVGYHNRDAENRAIFDEARGLRTGDLGYLDGDGFLFITGRIKEQYKLSNGKYVAPVRLEDRLKLSPRIASVMIYGDNRPYNVALVVPCAGDLAALVDGRLSEADLRRAIADDIRHLSQDWKGYERILAFALLTDDFTQANQLLTPSLKLKRRLVLQRWGHQIERLYSGMPGTNAIPCVVRAASE